MGNPNKEGARVVVQATLDMENWKHPQNQH